MTQINTTQLGLAAWLLDTPQSRVTQLALSAWFTDVPQFRITQLGLVVWGTPGIIKEADSATDTWSAALVKIPSQGAGVVVEGGPGGYPPSGPGSALAADTVSATVSAKGGKPLWTPLGTFRDSIYPN